MVWFETLDVERVQKCIWTAFERESQWVSEIVLAVGDSLNESGLATHHPKACSKRARSLRAFLIYKSLEWTKSLETHKLQ